VDPKAYVLFIHGFAEHIHRYDAYFRLLAAPPYALHITALDKRGHGRTSQQPLDDKAPQVVAWRKEGKTVHIQKGQRGRNGGWAKAMPDIEFFVRRESERAVAAGKKVFLYGHSMVGIG
jgi:acylglycerol lipase